MARQLMVEKGSAMQKYLKKPIPIEMVQWTADDGTTWGNAQDILDWVNSNGGRADCVMFWGSEISPKLRIQTPEGPMTLDRGGWVARGVKGEFYPIREDVHAESYTLADVADAADESAGE